MSSASEQPQYSTESYDIRPAKNNEETMQIWWPFMLRLGWDRGPSDLATYMDHSKSSGMLLIFPKGSSKPIGHVSAVVNDSETAWVAMFIIDPAYQGKLLGRALWDSMMVDFRRCHTRYLGLDAVPQQKATYERRGFIASGLGEINIMCRKLTGVSPTHGVNGAGGNIVEIRQVPYELLAHHENKFTGFHRKRLWTEDGIFHRPDVAGFALLRRSPPEDVDDILSWAVLRRCPSGGRIGPVYATNLKAAEAVLTAVMDAASPHYIRDVPIKGTKLSEQGDDKVLHEAKLTVEAWGGNPDALQLFEQLGWESVGVYHRMWLEGRAPPAQSEGGLAETGLFAIFDAAIG